MDSDLKTKSYLKIKNHLCLFIFIMYIIIYFIIPLNRHEQFRMFNTTYIHTLIENS